jgi:peroxiredoxin
MSEVDVGLGAKAPDFVLQNQDHQAIRLSDPGKKAAKMYQALSPLLLGLLGRAIVLIDGGGKITYRHRERIALSYRKPKELLEALKQIQPRKTV